MTEHNEEVALAIKTLVIALRDNYRLDLANAVMKLCWAWKNLPSRVSE